MSLRKSFDSTTPANISDTDEQYTVGQYTVFSQLIVNDDIAEDELTSFYKRTNNEIRKQLVSTLNDEQEEALRLHYLNELDTAVRKLEQAHHHSSGDARALYEEVQAKKLAREELFDVLHTSIDLLNTPAANPALPARAEKFFDCMNNIRDKGKSNFRWGIGYAILAGLLIAGAVTVLVLSFGHITTHISPGMAIGIAVMEGLQSISNGFKMFSSFKTASSQKSMAGKMEALGKSHAEPIAEESASSQVSPRLT